MSFLIFFIFVFLMLLVFSYSGKTIGTIPIGKVESFSYSQSFLINYTHIKTDKHTILLAHKITSIKEGDELLMKRFRFKKLMCNLSRNSLEYAIESINLLQSVSDFINSDNSKKIIIDDKVNKNAIKLKK